ncbi:MAG: AAA family ATPase [Polyangiaceae bacterium]
MIRRLTLQDVGPVRGLELDLAPRMNVLTGDNGLGKSFVLDVSWWVLTASWAGEKAFPFRPPPEDDRADPEAKPEDGAREGVTIPEIVAELAPRVATSQRDRHSSVRGVWSWESQEWARSAPAADSPSLPRSLVVYARIDGSYAVWDSHYVEGGAGASAAIVLHPAEVWDGKEVIDPEVHGGKRTVIAGLIADLVSWQQRASSRELESLRRVLHALSSPDEPFVLGEPTRVHLRDRRDIPTLVTSYGVVPVTHASAGVRRVLSLAYLLVWAFTEHLKAAKQRRLKPTQDVVILIDEPEMHLHPAWQRVFLPAVLRAVGMIAPNAGVQLLTSTHAPMVLASLESVFVEQHDDLFVFSRDGVAVRAREIPFDKEGDASSWLASDVFGRVGGRSREAKLAVDAAMDFMAGREAQSRARLGEFLERMRSLPADELSWLASVADESLALVERIHEALKHVLPGHDDLWAQWTLVHRPTGAKNATR